jgi:cytochrome c553
VRLRRILILAAAAAFSVVFALVLLPRAAFAEVNPDNARCLRCHADQAGTVSVNGRPKSLQVHPAVYDSSVHSLLDCTSCHPGFTAGDHTAGQTQGWWRQATLTSCGNCHAGQFAMYSGSFHGGLVMDEKSTAAPTCGACHGSHGIIGVTSPAFRPSILPMCQQCHGERSATYLDTYHGKAFLLGDRSAAVCTDCHGAHRILPQSNPASTISSRHIVATCAKCHPGANKSFTSYQVHLDPSRPGSSFASITTWLIYVAYGVLIAVVFTFGGVHSVLYFYRGWKEGAYRRVDD